jgi:pyridoxal phosphate enzyme (YggS family)
MSAIAANIAAVRERIAAAAERAHRPAAAITLIAVTKTHPASVVAAALDAGIADCGENRVQEADEKRAQLPDAVARWHLIGHLQRNKARRAVALFDMIHSLDSVRLAEALARIVAEEGRAAPLPVLLQVNVSGEKTKEGFQLAGGLRSPVRRLFQADVEQILALPQLDVQGLMTVAPYAEDPEAARPTFRLLRELRDDLAGRFPQSRWPHLSMGMTGDFEVAIEEGATLVRVGRALFGERG